MEVVRRLDEVARRLEDVQRHLEERYVPRREYEDKINGITKDLDDQDSFRRQVLGGLIVGMVLLLAQIVISLSRTPGVGS